MSKRKKKKLTNAEIISAISNKLSRKFGTTAVEPMDSVLESIIYAILLDDCSKQNAKKAFAALKENFVDWNEVRVTPIKEIFETISHFAKRLETAVKIKELLRIVFTKYNNLSLEFLRQYKGTSIARFLKQFNFINDTIIGLVLLSLAHYDYLLSNEDVMRVINRLNVFSRKKMSNKQVTSALQKVLSDEQSAGFCLLLSQLSAEICTSDEPDCKRCTIRMYCCYES